MNDEINMVVKPDSYSVKTTSDVTERIQELTKKTGLNHKDLFAAMVTRYYSELEAGSEIDRSDDMQQIRYHLNRAENIFLGSLQKVQDLKKDYAERLDALKAQHKETQEELQKKNTNLGKELEKLSTTQSETVSRLKELTERNQELEESNRGNRMTVDLLSKKIEELELKAAAVDPLKAEITDLQDKTLSYLQDLTHLRSELGTAQQTIANLEQHRTAVEKAARKHAEDLKVSYDKDLQQLKEVQKLEVDKMYLESERKILENSQRLKEEHDQKIEELLAKNDNFRTKNQELTEKIFTLELERLRLGDLAEPKVSSTR
jgi:chromosome segregation ATPase